MRTRRSGRWLPEQPRLGARMCLGTFFFHQLQGQKWRSESSRGAETSLQNLFFFTLTPTISTKSNPPIKTAVIILSAGLPDFA